MNTKTILCWFWLWDIEREEAWLNDLSAKGWHLKQIHFSCFYTFGSDTSAEFVYRLDMPISQIRNSEYDAILPTVSAPFEETTYLQFFEDSGWHYIGESFSKRFFRQNAHSDQVQEIYSDTSGKIKLLQRQLFCQLVLLLVVGLCMIYPHPRNVESITAWFVPRVLILLLFCPLPTLWQRIRQLQLMV